MNHGKFVESKYTRRGEHTYIEEKARFLGELVGRGREDVERLSKLEASIFNCLRCAINPLSDMCKPSHLHVALLLLLFPSSHTTAVKKAMHGLSIGIPDIDHDHDEELPDLLVG